MQRDSQPKSNEGQGDANAASEAKNIGYRYQSEPVKKSKKLVFYVDPGCSDYLIDRKEYLQSMRKESCIVGTEPTEKKTGLLES